jgi:type 1 fimbria pilin
MKRLLAALFVAGLVLAAQPSMAHTPLFSCYDNGDGTISCEGGFSDGSSAAGVNVHVFDGSGKTIEELKLGKFSEVTFKKPAGDYSVQFDAGEGHRIKVPGEDILE